VNATVAPRARRYATREEVEAALARAPTTSSGSRPSPRQYGLEIVDVREEERSVVLAGPVAAMDRAFGVELDRYQHPAGTFRGRTGAITVPADIADLVQAVLGLDDRAVARPHLRIVESRAPPPAPR